MQPRPVRNQNGCLNCPLRGGHSKWQAVTSVAQKLGCHAATVLSWVRQYERDGGRREGPTSSEKERIKALEREVKELRRTNEILRLASAFFAKAEFDRQSK